jgi:hypothetical protein
MNRLTCLTLSLVALSCSGPAANINQNNLTKPDVVYKMINTRSEEGTHFYDIYLKDTSAIPPLNDYLKIKYNSDGKSWIEINYFDDSAIAKDYFQKQLDNNLSDREKDKLFRHFVANYKFNPITGYDSLVSEH